MYPGSVRRDYYPTQVQHFTLLDHSDQAPVQNHYRSLHALCKLSDFGCLLTYHHSHREVSVRLVVYTNARMLELPLALTRRNAHRPLVWLYTSRFEPRCLA